MRSKKEREMFMDFSGASVVINETFVRLELGDSEPFTYFFVIFISFCILSPFLIGVFKLYYIVFLVFLL